MRLAQAGADEAERVDAEMAVEAAVLGGDHRLRQIRRQPVEADMAAPQAPLGEHGAVGGEDGEVRRPVVEGKQDRVGEAGDEIEEAADDDERDQGQRGEETAEQGAANGAGACAAAGGLAGFPRGRALAAEMRFDALFPLCRLRRWLWLPPRCHGLPAPNASDRGGGAPTNLGAQRLSASH